MIPRSDQICWKVSFVRMNVWRKKVQEILWLSGFKRLVVEVCMIEYWVFHHCVLFIATIGNFVSVRQYWWMGLYMEYPYCFASNIRLFGTNGKLIYQTCDCVLIFLVQWFLRLQHPAERDKNLWFLYIMILGFFICIMRSISCCYQLCDLLNRTHWW